MSAIELELFRQMLGSIADEMGIVLRKTAYSANIKERRDYSCALYDRNGQTVAMGEHMPVHLGAMPLSVDFARQAFRFREGDIVILNDPFRGGTHLPDITAVSGVFLSGDKTPSFYLANRAHHADVGGMSPGSMPLAQEIFQEGIRIPPTLLVSGGKVQSDVWNLILANVRTPIEREGDLLAQLMSLRRGDERVRALASRYGKTTVARNMKRLQSYSEKMMRAALRDIPDGAFSFEDYLDDDGAGGPPVRIAVTVKISRDQAEVDFSGSDPQAAGPVNANRAILMAATAYVFRCLLHEDVPFTSGLLRPIRITATDGSVVSAVMPAAMAAGNVETSQRITDVLLGALAQVLPKRIPAASSGTMNNLSFGGYDTRRQRPFAYYETIAGGMGAGPENDGHSATHTHMTNSWNTPIEALEHQLPLRIREYSLRRGSGGSGARKGGDGVVREWEFLERAKVTFLADRRLRAPYGLEGGAPGSPGRNVLIRRGRATITPSKTEFYAQPGDIFRIETPGGGGHGHPLE
ncbi:MAG TPA: hydantoinase B/oxoprolinase family protein [Bryobacteraceae bacterium]|nr:hydantoinase B/oxoprolinase family protein [Bryobacteraceae bacterium]